MRALTTLFRKELAYEVRSFQTVSALLSLSILTCTVIGLGLSGSFLPPVMKEKVFPTLLWLTFLFSSTMAVSRSFESERRGNAFEAVILTGTPLWKLFFSKALFLWLTVWLAQCLSTVLLPLLIGIPFTDHLSSLVLLAGVTALGYAPLALLLTAMSSSSRLKGVLLPILLLPPLFPLFFAAIEVTSQVIFQDARLIGNFWFSFLCIIDVIYLLLGINLFEHVVRE